MRCGRSEAAVASRLKSLTQDSSHTFTWLFRLGPRTRRSQRRFRFFGRDMTRDLRDLIDVSGWDGTMPMPTAIPLAPVTPPAGHPINAAAARPLRVLRPKRTADDRLHFKWFQMYLDNHDWHFASHRDGVPRQITNERIEEFLNRSGKWDDPANLPKLRAIELANHRAGKTSKLYGRPRRCRHNQYVVFRLDADAHLGESDAAALIRWARDTYFPDLYDEGSDRGWSGYAVIEFKPKGYLHDGTAIYPSKREINVLLNRLQVALRTLTAHKFKAKLEVCGRFATPVTYDDGTKGMPAGHRGTTIKVPRCPGPGDPAKLWASKFPMTIIYEIIADADARNAQPAADPEVHPVTKSSRLKTHRLMDTGDKHRNRLNCLLSAKLELFGSTDPAELSPADLERWVDRFNKIYHGAGLNSAERDCDRDAWACNAIRWMTRTHDGGAVGHGLWFTLEQDYNKALELARSRFSRASLRDANNANAAKLDGEEVTYHVLALVILIMLKNIHSGRLNDVPVSSVIGMLRFFKVRANWTLARLCMKLLTSRRGLFNVIDSTVGHDRCRKFGARPLAYTLPFVTKLGPAEAGDHKGNTEAGSPAGRGRQSIIIDYDALKINKRIVPAGSPANRASNRFIMLPHGSVMPQQLSTPQFWQRMVV